MSSNTTSTDSQPSMIAGHVKYAQGLASQALGSTTAENTKAEAVQEMKDAKAQADATAQQKGESTQPTQSGVLGSVEKTLGSAVGCEGMVEEEERRYLRRGELRNRVARDEWESG